MDAQKTSIQKNPLKLVAIILRIIVIVFAGVTALCGIIALSKVNIDEVRAEIEAIKVYPELGKYAIYTSTLVCGSLLLLACGGTLLYEIIIFVKSIVSKDENTKVLSIVETVLGSISAVVFFGLAIGLVNPANEYAKFGIQHPLIMSDQATAAFGFLTTFAIAGLIVFLWIKFYIEKSRAA